MTECVTEYINFCVDNTRAVRGFPNHQPWITSDLKELLNKNKRAFREGRQGIVRSVQKQLKVKIRDN